MPRARIAARSMTRRTAGGSSLPCAAASAPSRRPNATTSSSRTVGEEPPVPAAPAQREHRAEQDRAVAAEHERRLAGVEHLADRAGEVDGVARDARGVAEAVPGIAPPVVHRRVDPAGPPRAEPLRQPRSEQRSR
jgi:hypothetical protein